MLILGVDPGIGRMGICVVEEKNGKVKPLFYDCIQTEPNGKIEERLLKINSETEELIKRFRPDVLSIEEVFFSSNAKTAFAVGQARGVVLLCAARNKIKVAIYTPLQVKMSLTGYGRADKNQIAQMVKVILKLDKIPKIDDTSDALAVALTHAFTYKMSKLNARH
ncbi:MAG: crossover junction endodeoxyribonuclease RuvC [Candidatus Levybacteria bacterium]|nr:crossover junction endodeoxyribonuclease RuvC [Candidatus Levybacteria bacterium]